MVQHGALNLSESVGAPFGVLEGVMSGSNLGSSQREDRLEHRLFFLLDTLAIGIMKRDDEEKSSR